MATVVRQKRSAVKVAQPRQLREWSSIADLPTREKARRETKPAAARRWGKARGDEVFVAVMGVTGAGKSSFIQKATGDSRCKIGRSLESETQEVNEYRCQHNGRTYVLIDTPGFDDSYRTNDSVVESILGWLEASYRAGTRLSGIIYLHRISDVRMQGSAFDNLRMFRKLCGDDALKNVLLVTTFWDTVTSSEGNRREQELATNDEFWGRMVKKHGSKMRRWTRNDDSATTMAILGTVAPATRVALKAQIEIVEEGKKLNETEAARAAAADMKAEVNARLKREQEEMTRRLERQQREAQRKIQWERARLNQEAEERRRREQEARRQAEEEAHQEWMRQQMEIQEDLRRENERQKREQKRVQRAIEKEMRRAEQARYYANYRCRQNIMVRSRTCGRCYVNLHRHRDYYYHCCHCLNDNYYQCSSCGQNCKTQGHPPMSRHLTLKSDCVVM